MTIEQLYSIYLQYPSVQTDTRKLKQGDLYFALKGDQFDGNQFAAKAIESGAAYAIVDNPSVAVSEKMILVDDVLTTLQSLAKHHRLQFDFPFIAITGSNGKTTTKELILAVLSTTFKTYATEGNLNNHIGVPLTLLKIKSDAQMAIIEMGANHLHEIESYCLYALPDWGLINNCGKAHLEGFGGEEGVRKGKGELFDFIRSKNGGIFRNADLVYLASMATGINTQITYGETNCDFQGKVFASQPFLQVAVISEKEECLLKTQLVGDYNFPNVMAAFAIGRHFGIPVNIIQSAIQDYTPSNSRSQLIKVGSTSIILDAYNANPSSMKAAIQNFEAADFPNKVIMLGAMKELGNESQQEHQALVNLLELSNWNYVVLVGAEFKAVRHNYLHFDTVDDATYWYQHLPKENTAFLVKGSRAYTMEKIVQSKN
jgi:UDP-N-acetylmuramoyl-tripeptide--D-alanyl-D-alanine ligase